MTIIINANHHQNDEVQKLKFINDFSYKGKDKRLRRLLFMT